MLTFCDQSIGRLKPTPDWCYLLCTLPSDRPAVTVIEFSSAALAVLSRAEYSRLRPAEAAAVESRRSDNVSISARLSGADQRAHQPRDW